MIRCSPYKPYKHVLFLLVSLICIFLQVAEGGVLLPGAEGGGDGCKDMKNDENKPGRLISPLQACTFLGDSGDDTAYAIDMGPDGDVYVAGHTASVNFPVTAGAYDTTYNGGSSDIFIARFDKELKILKAATFLGGNDGDAGVVLVVRSDAVYVAGGTRSTDFPATQGAWDESHNGDEDVFVARFDLELNDLQACTYLGGNKKEKMEECLAMDAAGNVYISGNTLSIDFPVTVGAFDETFNGGDDEYGGDFFVSQLNKDLTTLVASTYVGGNDDDWSTGITVDLQGHVYIIGFSSSPDYPTTPQAYDTTYAGGTGYIKCDAVVTRLNPALDTVMASTFLGKSQNELGHGIDVDASGRVFIIGYTDAVAFPTTQGAFDRTYGGQCDGFVCRFDSNLENLEASTYLGGNNTDHPIMLMVLDDGIYIPGYTESSDHPCTAGSYDPDYNGNMDGYVSVLNHDLTTLLASTYVGGSEQDRGHAMVRDAQGNVFVVGITMSSDFPITPGAFDNTYGGGAWGADVFVMKIDDTLSDKTLDADTHELSATNGGEVGFLLDAGTQNGGRAYLLLGSASGTSPGYPLPGGMAVLPLNFDPFTDLVLGLMNTSLFQDFLNNLSAAGDSTASLVSPPLPAIAVGVVIHFAFCLGWPFEFVSNAVEVVIV
ncbi:MAG: hypothetical protein ABIK28_10875 [Planctomycetota bacterium]